MNFCLGSESDNYEVCVTDFLQEISNAFSIRAFEAHILEKGDHLLTRTLIDNDPFREENNIIEEIESFRSWLEKSNECCAFKYMNRLSKRIHNLKCCGAI